VERQLVEENLLEIIATSKKRLGIEMDDPLSPNSLVEPSES
jgi:hypothetical protein